MTCIRITILAAAVALAVSACGGSTEDSAATDTTGSDAAVAPTSEPTTDNAPTDAVAEAADDAPDDLAMDDENIDIGADDAFGVASFGVEADTLSDEGVAEAAVIILTYGDLETALADGIVTEAEVEAALRILDGTAGITLE
ncbi:MAG: hypothetical protein AAF467_06820 [Actinomycetota bacterium]